jgi:hypothetical protein
MDRLQISLPTQAWDRIKNIAYSERRSPKQQIEYWVLEALHEHEKITRPDTSPQELSHAN